MLRAGELSSER
jgi:hypothetical protein